MKGNFPVCSKCKRRVDPKEVLVIDGLPVCKKCIFGDAEPFEIYPIGRVVNRAGESRIDIIPSQGPFMYGLEQEDFLTIVYYLHKSRGVKSVFNRRVDGKKVGVFASRTPHRLSKIGMQDVRLLKVEGMSLYVEGLDAIDGTPVLDIKVKIKN